MNDQYVKNVIEAALLAAGRPLSMDELVSVFDERDGSNAEEVRGALAALTADYETRGLELLEVASGYRIQIRASVAQPVSRLWQERPAKYSRALLETLALVAYRQPITRGEIEQIRGVAVNPNIIKTLLERSWIRVVGHRDVPGKPELLGTTREFLDYFSLKKLDDLPTLAQLKELEDLRVQLTLPGADPLVAAESSDASGAQAAASERRRMTMTRHDSPDGPRADDEARPGRCGRMRTATRRSRRAWSPAVRKTIRIDATQSAAPATVSAQAIIAEQSITAEKRSAAGRTRAEAAVGGGHRLAPRGGALDPRGAAASERRRAGAGRQTHAAGPHHAGRPAGQIARAGGQGIARAVVSPLAGRDAGSEGGDLARRRSI